METIFTEITQVVECLDYNEIPPARRKVLRPLVDYIRAKVAGNEPIRLNFICTHNSRRSHLSQVWAQTMASYYGVSNLTSYSGGTEATALFPMVALTLEEMGFRVQRLSEKPNPVYAIAFSDQDHPVIGFSKKHDDPFNPKQTFAAVMTCSSADEGCPFIPGAELRVPITFEDPKAFDNTPQQAEKYHERSLDIARELGYVFSEVVS